MSRSPCLCRRRRKQQREDSHTYCFGFDYSSRRYKIVHGGFYVRRDETMNQELQVYTVGGGENWRRAHGATVSYGCVFADGAVWSVAMNRRRLRKVVRFNLATEKITLEATALHLPVETPTQSEMAKFFRPAADSTPWVMTYGLEGEWV